MFICEFQESDKSHSLSCMLKNCLISNVCATQLSNSLTELVFHYDLFTSTVDDHACESAHLCSFKIEVTEVLQLHERKKKSSDCVTAV